MSGRHAAAAGGTRPARRRARSLVLVLAAAAVAVVGVDAVAAGVEPTSAAWADPVYGSGAISSAVGPVLNGRVGGVSGTYVPADTGDAGTAADLGTALTGLQPGSAPSVGVALQNTSGARVAVAKGPAPTVSGLPVGCAVTPSVANPGSANLNDNATTTSTISLTVPTGLLPSCWNAAGTLTASWTATLTGNPWVNPAYFRGTVSLGTWVWYGQVNLSGTNLCLDVVSRLNVDGQGVQVYACNQTPAQIWTFNPDGSIKVYQSVGLNNPNDNPTPRCLDVTSQSTADDVALQIYTCGYSGTVLSQPNQTWSLVNNGDGTVQIRSALAGTNPAGPRCLDVPSNAMTAGTTARVASCASAGRARSWVLSTVPNVAY